ncbi:MAG: ABC transporter substrate-binding protein [Alphaproteobacteria bacterium]
MTMTRRATMAAALSATAFAAGRAGAQEARELRIAKQFGISDRALAIIEERRLVEKHAEAQGLAGLRVSWSQMSAGAPMNDALIAGSLDVAGGGVGPLVTIWARTRSSLGVRGIAALNSMPLYLNAINPAVRTLRDFGERDRIALPAVKVSIQAVTLQMAAERELGRFDALDQLTVSMSHPDGHAAMMSGRSEVTAHFTSAPFMYQQLADQRVRRVLSSYDVLGGPATFNTLWATNRWREANPRTLRALLAALDEAMAMIRDDPAGAAALWIRAEKSTLAQDFIEKMVRDPENVFTTVPQNVTRYAEFMHKVGSVREKPASWKDMFFPEVHALAGS